MLSISSAELFRRGTEGIYPFVVDEKTGWRWYPEDSITNAAGVTLEQAKKERVTRYQRQLLAGAEADKRTKKDKEESVGVTPSANFVKYNADAAKKVFAALANGKTPLECVTQLGVHPHIVKKIAIDFADLSGGFFVSESARLQIEKLPLQGELPITGVDHLLAILKASLGIVIPCGKCGKQRARVCLDCTPEVASNLGYNPMALMQQMMSGGMNGGALQSPAGASSTQPSTVPANGVANGGVVKEKKPPPKKYDPKAAVEALYATKEEEIPESEKEEAHADE
jgi:hypothetical protein